VIPLQHERGLGADAPQARPRLRAVANEVAETDERVVRLGQDGLEGREISVDVGDDEDPQGDRLPEAQDESYAVIRT
jgi:hypothetical protein